MVYRFLFVELVTRAAKPMTYKRVHKVHRAARPRLPLLSAAWSEYFSSVNPDSGEPRTVSANRPEQFQDRRGLCVPSFLAARARLVRRQIPKKYSSVVSSFLSFAVKPFCETAVFQELLFQRLQLPAQKVAGLVDQANDSVGRYFFASF